MDSDVVRRAAAAAAGLWASEAALGERLWAMGGLRAYRRDGAGGGYRLTVVSPDGPALAYVIVGMPSPGLAVPDDPRELTAPVETTED